MRIVQPQYFDHFRCIGADCEDTCCAGWGVIVDLETYKKYQNPELERISGEALGSLVEINPASTSSSDYAKMRLAGTHCVALHDGLCSIQQRLGETYIPDMCSSFPRVLNVAGGVVEKSLHLSCPEAARLALLDPDAMVFRRCTAEEPPSRPGALSWVGAEPEDQLHQARDLMIQGIRERCRPLWQRIAVLGLSIEEVARVPTQPAASIVADHFSRLRQGLLDEVFDSLPAAPAVQFEAVVELIVARFGLEYISPRFLECYRDFLGGLGWTLETTMQELGDRYLRAQQSYSLPFLRRHEHLFENYLVNYMFRTLFPYGRQLPDTRLAMNSSGESIKSTYLLFAVHYAILRTMLIGMAARYEQNLSVEHVVKLVQSCSKAFQHSSCYAAAVREHLARHSEDPMRSVVVLLRD